MTEEVIYFTLAGIVLFLVFISVAEEVVKSIRGNERCKICGYLKRGPFHDEERCEAEHEARTISEDELKKRKLFRTNKDKLGF